MIKTGNERQKERKRQTDRQTDRESVHYYIVIKTKSIGRGLNPQRREDSQTAKVDGVWS